MLCTYVSSSSLVRCRQQVRELDSDNSGDQRSEKRVLVWWIDQHGVVCFLVLFYSFRFRQTRLANRTLHNSLYRNCKLTSLGFASFPLHRHAVPWLAFSSILNIAILDLEEIVPERM